MPNIPIPKLSIRKKHEGIVDIRKFILLGKKNVEIITTIAKQQGLVLECASILDFGCGCGINLRHWSIPKAKIIGIDSDEDQLSWCKLHMPQFRYDILDLKWFPKIPSASCDLVYATNIFTNFSEKDQNEWLENLTYLLKPKGLLLIFTRSDTESLVNLKDDERRAYEHGNLVVINQMYSGTEKCKSCHPKRYILQNFSKFIPIIDVIPAHSYFESGTSIYVKPVVVMRKMG